MVDNCLVLGALAFRFISYHSTKLKPNFLDLLTWCDICRSVVGEVDEDLDARLDLSKLRAHPLKPVIH